MANVILKTEEEHSPHAPVLTLPPVAETTAAVEAVAPAHLSPVASPLRRYDQATIEHALALAVQMQQEHQATLSAEQVVRLGEEINVDQAFVLRALAQIDAPTMTTAAPTATRAVQGQAVQATQTQQDLPRLTRTGRYASVFFPFLFALVSFFVFSNPATLLAHSNNWFAIAWMLGGGMLVALLMGTALRSKRLGTLSGFFNGLFLCLSASIATIGGGDSLPLASFFFTLFVFTLTGATLGLTAAMCRQYIPRAYRRVVIALLRHFPQLADQT